MANKIEKLALKTAELTRQTHELGIPVMILFEGVPASGKTRLSNELLLNLMPNIHILLRHNHHERMICVISFTKYWNTLPKKVISMSILEAGTLII